MEPLAIAPDTVVTLSYVLFDQRGEAVDRVSQAEPLTYVHGYAQLVPGLERQIEGLKAGARGVFTVPADEAFGEHDDDAVFEVDKADFPDAGDVVVGDEFMAEGPDGEPVAMRVLEVRPDAFVVDTNHPLAGQSVRFEVEVGSVRAAREDEIAAAQAELEEVIAAENEASCGCGHSHDGDADPHHDHDHDHSDVSLIQIARKS
jgi:FKBP-type peptidyl-prolyl cis-trans isomerase SlyD